MSNLFSSTCAALSSAKGKAGVAVIRISGENAISIADKVFKPIRKTLTETESNKAIFGEIYSGDDCFDNGLATVFRAPKSFTGEDTVEICCHGSEVSVSMLLSALFAAGAVPAEPGEFTKRAFLNGKIDLTQAEATAALIEARSVSALKLSEAQSRGLLGEKIGEISASLLTILSSVYAYIDYPDEDIADMSSEEMASHVRAVLSTVKALSDTYDIGRAVTDGIRCAIVGSPNVGKSSLLNLLCGSERAIVTDIAGTTRDVITESVKVGNISLLMSDTAGIRETADTVEMIGVERSYKEIDEAELIIFVADTSREISDEDKTILRYLSENSYGKKIITVLNKCDTECSCLDETERCIKEFTLPSPVRLSAKNGDGVNKLREAISAFFPAGDAEIKSGLILTNARQFASLKKAEEALEASLTALDCLTPDMACSELEGALAALRETDGRNINEEIVSEIFSHFCVGK